MKWRDKLIRTFGNSHNALEAVAIFACVGLLIFFILLEALADRGVFTFSTWRL